MFYMNVKVVGEMGAKRPPRLGVASPCLPTIFAHLRPIPFAIQHRPVGKLDATAPRRR